MTQLPIWQRWWVQTAISLVGAILVAVLTHWLSLTPSLKENIVVVVGVWVVGMIFQIAYSIHSFHVDKLETKRVLEVIDAGDCLLLELQSKLREIASRPLSGKPNQVFIDYCHRSLKQALNVAKDAAQRGELKVRDHHFDTVDTVMGAFQGCQDRTFRCVWLIEDGNLFDDSWRKYMKCLVELSRRRSKTRQVQVRILFVVDDDLNDRALLKRRSVARVLGFVSGERNFECRLISRRDYRSQLHDAGLSNQCLDFGVYGDHLLFRTTNYEPTNEGVFSIDSTMIQQYRRVHDLAMAATQSRALPSNLPESVSLEEFVDCDSAGAVSEATVPHGEEQ